MLFIDLTALVSNTTTSVTSLVTGFTKITPGYSQSQTTGGRGSSDIRLKENVKQVGTSSAGYKIYEFNYKGNSTKLRGVMAQDVVTKNPMAVDIVDNYLVVDYSKVDVPMEVV